METPVLLIATFPQTTTFLRGKGNVGDGWGGRGEGAEEEPGRADMELKALVVE